MSSTSLPTSTCSTNSPILPPELILRIFGYLDPNSKDDRSALTQCALISTSFRHDAQRQLFSSVNLPYTIATEEPPTAHAGVMTADTAQSSDFRNAITRSPILATLIRRLHIYLPSWNLSPSSTKPHKPESNSLPFVLSYMTHLEAFSWHSPPNFRLIYFKLSMKVQSAIREVLLTNNLRELDLRGVNQFPPGLLCSSSKLLTLAVTDLREYRVMDIGRPQPPRSIMLATLTTLTLSNGLASLVRFLQAPSCPISLSMLQSLDVKACGPEHESVRAILGMCGNTLTHLHCHFQRPRPALSSGPPPSYPSIDLSNLLRLTYLHLSGNVENERSVEGKSLPDPHNAFSPIPWIAGALQSLSDASAVSISLTVELRISDAPLDTIHWGVLVDAIQLRDREYGSLRVNLGFSDLKVIRSCEVVPDLQEKRDYLKEDGHLKKLGHALVFI